MNNPAVQEDLTDLATSGNSVSESIMPIGYWWIKCNCVEAFMNFSLHCVQIVVADSIVGPLEDKSRFEISSIKAVHHVLN